MGFFSLKTEATQRLRHTGIDVAAQIKRSAITNARRSVYCFCRRSRHTLARRPKQTRGPISRL